MMVDLIVGIGQGGCRLTKQFAESLDAKSVYCNLTSTDFSKMDVSRKDRYIIEVGGTGKDPEFGSKVVKKNIADYKKFLSSYTAESVMVVVGGGGGSGSPYFCLCSTFFLWCAIDMIFLGLPSGLLIVISGTGGTRSSTQIVPPVVVTGEVLTLGAVLFGGVFLLPIFTLIFDIVGHPVIILICSYVSNSNISSELKIL